MEQKQIADANVIKRILEEETGDRYVLKRESELIHKDGTNWFIHLPFGEGIGWVDYASEKTGILMLETPTMFDTLKRMSYDYPRQLGKKRLKSAIASFQDKEVRAKFADKVPVFVAFFDKLDRTLVDVNKVHSTKLSIVNSSGAVSVKAEILEQGDVAEAVRKNIRAMKDFDLRISRWLKKEYDAVVEAKVE